jgi:hypothetical protein
MVKNNSKKMEDDWKLTLIFDMKQCIQEEMK